MSQEEKDQKISELERENKALREKIAELERRLGINSETSSKPPSSDGLKAKKRTKSLREKGKRKSGGQKGHLGQTLEQLEKADHIINHQPVCKCVECGYGCNLYLIKNGIVRILQEIHTDQVFPKIDSIFPSSIPTLVDSK